MLIGHGYCNVWTVHVLDLSFVLFHPVTFALIFWVLVLREPVWVVHWWQQKGKDGGSCLVTCLEVD